jgi:outer membrane immunogenic protein
MLRGIMGILLAAVAVPAFAADMPVKAPPAAAPIVDWSGVYSGFAAGGAWGHQNLNLPLSLSNFFGKYDFDIRGAHGVCAFNDCNKLHASGFIGGGFAGVQKQWGSWVIGIEGSWDWTSMKKTFSATRSEVFAPVTVTRSIATEAKLDQIADLRGKFGWANTFLGPNWLFYFTGGAAVGRIERSLVLTQTVSVAGDGSFTDTFSSTTGDTRLGWVAGAGFDWKMTPNVILGVLYRHHDFPKGTVSFIDDTGSGTGRPVSFGTNSVHVDSVQGRLSWLFPIQ